MEPWHVGGPVIKGFGRGSKVLGIPTGISDLTIYAALLNINFLFSLLLHLVFNSTNLGRTFCLLSHLLSF